MDIKEKLITIPHSYDDFVRFSSECIEQDPEIEKAVMEQLRMYPESDTNDITKILCDHLGIGEPLELVDDDPPFRHVKAAML